MRFSDIVMFASAAISGVAAIVWLSDRGVKVTPDIRKRIVEIARSELGQKDVARYVATAAPAFAGQKPEWCGIFALWVLKQAGLATGITWIVAKGFLFRLPQTKVPKPGDIAYFEKYQHQAIIAEVRGDSLVLINGNGKGGVVTENVRPISDARAIYSIQPWVDAAEGIAS
jgi:hypothetical protein